MIGDTQDKDTLVYEEVDPEFSININKSTSKDFLMINIEKTNSNEIKIVDLKINKKIYTPFLEKKIIYIELIIRKLFLYQIFQKSFIKFTESNLYEVMRCSQMKIYIFKIL